MVYVYNIIMLYIHLKFQKIGELVDMAEKLKRQRKMAASNMTDRMNVSASLRMPLYHQIYLILRQKILSGDYTFDDLIPSELDLVDEYSVSRITARRALDELAKEGLVKRERGKGTKVQFRQPTQPLESSVEGLLENLLAMGLESSVKLIDFEYVSANSEVAKALDCPPSTIVQRAVRVRSFETGPFSYLVTYVPQGIGSNYDANDLASYPLLQLMERGGVEVAGAKQTISAALADADVAALLETEVGVALLEMRRIVTDVAGRPVEYIRALYRPDRYQYNMVLSRILGEDVNTWSS
jgi:GntR family transcriptional regulator